MHTSKIGVALPGYKIHLKGCRWGPATSCSNSASRKKTWTWHKFQKQWQQQKIWLNLGAVKVRKNSCRAAKLIVFSLERTCSHHLGQTKSCGRTSQKMLRFTHRKFLFILTAKRKIKNCLDIMSGPQFGFCPRTRANLGICWWTTVIYSCYNWDC